ILGRWLNFVSLPLLLEQLHASAGKFSVDAWGTFVRSVFEWTALSQSGPFANKRRAMSNARGAQALGATADHRVYDGASLAGQDSSEASCTTSYSRPLSPDAASDNSTIESSQA